MVASDFEQENVRKRRLRVLQARLAGVPFHQILEQEADLKSASDVAQDLRRALEDRKLLRESSEAVSYLDFELMRLDLITQTAQLAMRSAAAEGNFPLALQAGDRLMKVSKRVDVLLGLEKSDGPKAVRPSNPLDEVRRKREEKNRKSG